MNTYMFPSKRVLRAIIAKCDPSGLNVAMPKRKMCGSCDSSNVIASVGVRKEYCGDCFSNIVEVTQNQFAEKAKCKICDVCFSRNVCDKRDKVLGWINYCGDCSAHSIIVINENQTYQVLQRKINVNELNPLDLAG